MHQAILIIDFGSQYTQLIARRVRELNVYCEIHPFNHLPTDLKRYNGIILSGGPSSVRDQNAPEIPTLEYRGKYPVLGVCYGAQLLAQQAGGNVMPSNTREYGRAHLSNHGNGDVLLKNISSSSQVWMSHADTITDIPAGFEVI